MAEPDHSLFNHPEQSDQYADTDTEETDHQ